MTDITETSILKTVKKLVNVAEDYHQFDYDILTHINSVFSMLNQMGVGPKTTFKIMGETEIWTDFTTTEIDINEVISYMGLKVRMLFDPPTTTPSIQAMERLISEMEWRLNVKEKL